MITIKTHSFPNSAVLSIFGVLLLAVGAIVTSCGGGGGDDKAAGGDGDSLSLENYFQQARAIADVQHEKVLALNPDFQKGFAEEDFDAIRVAYDTALANSKYTFDEMDEIDPPALVESAHREFVRAGRALTSVVELFVMDLADVETGDGFDAAVIAREEGGAVLAEARFDAACVRLEALAGDNGIDVNLYCE